MDPESHATARSEALASALEAGRSGLVDGSRAAIVEWIGRSFGTASYDPTFIALGWRHEPLRVEDRALLADTLADAALACIVRDRVDEATADELIGPCAALVDGPGADEDRQRGDVPGPTGA